MAAIALTSELDNFDIETSFEDFIKETQHKLMSMPSVQDDEQSTPINCDLSSFMSINFDVAEKEPSSVQVLQHVATTVLSNELTSQVVKGVGLFAGLTEQNAAVAVVHQDNQLSPVQHKELLFGGLTEQDAAVSVAYQDTKFSAEELVCLEVLESGFQEPLKEGFIEETFNYSEHAFSYSQDGETVTKSVIPSVLSLKKGMAYKQALRTAIDSRLRMELEDFNIPKKACKKRSIIMQGWRSNDPNNPFAKARDQFLDEMFDEILDISTRIENSEYGFLASKKRK